MNDWDVIVIGGGPAGLGATIEAARTGAKVLLVDENHTAGGQLFKQIHKFFGSKAHSAGMRGFQIAKNLLEDIENAGVEVWLDSAVIGVFPGNRVQIRRNLPEGAKIFVLQGKTLLFATGASENTICFPGWTIPGVMGAGAAQTMINVNRVLPGKRVLMVGSGNVGLIVSYQLMQAGADVVGVIEAMDHVGGYGVHASKIRRAGVDFFLSHSVVRAEAKKERINKVIIAELNSRGSFIPGTEKEFAVDTLCLAVGLRPLTELLYLCGAKQIFVPEMSGWIPLHDENMMTTVPGVYVAGDVTGVEEASTALDEGRLAGIAIAERLGYLSSYMAKEKKAEIVYRLDSLRKGPFGEFRANAKKRILKYATSDHSLDIDISDDIVTYMFVKGKV